jgi:hypothetical protein
MNALKGDTVPKHLTPKLLLLLLLLPRLLQTTLAMVKFYPLQLFAITECSITNYSDSGRNIDRS